MAHFILDCDDVLLDWENGFRDFMARRDVILDPSGPQSWDMSEWIGCDQAAAASWVDRFNSSVQFAHLDIMPGAYEFVWALRDQGHTASVLTACGTATKTRQRRVGNLAVEFEKFGRSDPFTAVEFLNIGQTKFDVVRAHAQRQPDTVFIEDNFAHARAGAVCGIRSYCLRRNHNRADERDNPATAVTWVDALGDVLADLEVARKPEGNSVGEKSYYAPPEACGPFPLRKGDVGPAQRGQTKLAIDLK